MSSLSRSLGTAERKMAAVGGKGQEARGEAVALPQAIRGGLGSDSGSQGGEERLSGFGEVASVDLGQQV